MRPQKRGLALKALWRRACVGFGKRYLPRINVDFATRIAQNGRAGIDLVVSAAGGKPRRRLRAINMG